MSFGAIVAIIFVVLGVLNAIGKAGKGTGTPGGRFPGRMPQRPLPPGQPRPEYTRPGGTTAGSASAETLLPAELWAILTGQAPPPTAPTAPPRPAAPGRPASPLATRADVELASGDRAEVDWAGEQMAGGRELAEQEEQSLERSAFEIPERGRRDEEGGLLRIPRQPPRGGVPATSTGPGALAARLSAAQEIAREAESRAAASQSAPLDVIAASAIGVASAQRASLSGGYGESLRDRRQVRRAMVLQVVLGPPRALE